jgi:membrane associated rhomboid family serine protease
MTTPDQPSPYGQETPPTCYRHPDRESWVSCVRCGRHACPDCLRSAAVGQQCVDCVSGAGQTGPAARRPTTVFGGRPTRNAVVTYTLVALNVLLFVVEHFKPGIANDWALLGYAPYTNGGPVQGIAAGQWYRLITSAFLPPTGSFGFLDIAFNMWALFVVGPSLEQLLGRTRFIAVYLLSALGGGVAFFLIGQPYVPALGASGAIFGLFGAWFVVSRRLQLDSRGILVLIGINLAFSFIYRSTIAWQDHVGGLIVGMLVTAAFAYAPRKNRVVVQAAAVVAVLVILIVIVVLRTNHLTAEYGQAAGL